MLTWWRQQRRKRYAARTFPDEWAGYLTRNIRHYRALSDDQQAQVRKYVLVFLSDKHWEGVRGVTVSEEMKVTIAGQVAVLTLGMPGQYFDRVKSIIINEEDYVRTGVQTSHGGLVIEEDSYRSGEAWYRGPVVLSWRDVLTEGRRWPTGHNLVFHEFAHQLDMLNGRSVDGTPPLADEQQYEHWERVHAAAYERLCQDCRFGRRTPLDCYGTGNRAEFFAVATEAFFETPVELRRHDPDLYATLRAYYNRDPAERV